MQLPPTTLAIIAAQLAVFTIPEGVALKQVRRRPRRRRRRRSEGRLRSRSTHLRASVAPGCGPPAPVARAQPRQALRPRQSHSLARPAACRCASRPSAWWRRRSWGG
jgi:hypothetical protein